MEPRCRGVRVGVGVAILALPGVPAVPVDEGVGIATEAVCEVGALVVDVLGGTVVVDPAVEVDGIVVATPVWFVAGF